MLKNFWYACEFSHLITNSKPKQIELWNQRIVLYRDTAGKVVALKDVCPHRSAALSLGTVDGDCIRCPYHGWQFQTDGRCHEIPSNPPNTPIPPRAKVTSYPVQEKYGFVWLFWGDRSPETCPPLPSFLYLPDPKWRPIYFEYKMNAHYTRVLTNSMDPIHTAFVHSNSLGGTIKDPHHLTKGKIFLEEWGASRILFRKQSPKKGIWRFLPDADTVQTTAMFLPNLVIADIHSKARLLIYALFLPVTETTTIIKQIQFRSFFNYAWADGLFHKLNLEVFQEDQAIIESQRPQRVPDDLTTELNVAGDSLSVAYCKLRKKARELDWDNNSVTHSEVSEIDRGKTPSPLEQVISS